MGIARTVACCFVALTPVFAPAGVLYKSVDANGVVTFSDMPPQGNARVVEQRAVPTAANSELVVADSGAPRIGSSGEPIVGTPPEKWLGSDPIVAQANERLDAAERSLAAARRAVGSPLDGMRMRNVSLTRDDESRIEQEKANVLTARRALMDLLRDRKLALKHAQAQAAGLGGGTGMTTIILASH